MSAEKTTTHTHCEECPFPQWLETFIAEVKKFDSLGGAALPVCPREDWLLRLAENMTRWAKNATREAKYLAAYATASLDLDAARMAREVAAELEAEANDASAKVNVTALAASRKANIAAEAAANAEAAASAAASAAGKADAAFWVANTIAQEKREVLVRIVGILHQHYSNPPPLSLLPDVASETGS